MILPKGSDNNYLLDYRHNRIIKGLGINCDLDNYIKFKQGQYVGVLGGNNVGKTYFMSWYFMCLSLIHGLKWTLWMDENKKGRVLRDLIQFYTGKRFEDLSDEQILYASDKVEDYFMFVDNEKLYCPDDLLALMKSTNPSGVLLDPFNQLNRTVGYSDNITFIRTIKHWCKTSKITLYLTMHPNTETQRRSAQYPQGHEWEGHAMMPLKHNAEGGSLYSNMSDDWINLNRLNKLDSMKYFTMVDIDKIKDIDTGGSISKDGVPLLFNFNSGLGFMIAGVNPIIKYQLEFQRLNFGISKPLTLLTDFPL